MRKIIALVLAVVMIAAMSVTVFAAETKLLADEKNSEKSDTTLVEYTSAQGYEVEIPEKITLTDEEGDGVATGSDVVTAKKAKLNNGMKLIVTVTSQNSFSLKDTGGADDIAYSIAVENTANNGGISGALGADGKVLEYTSNKETWSNKVSTLNFTTAYSNQAGNFSDTLTFKAEVK